MLEIIKSSAEISDFFTCGKRIFTPHITLITSSKKCGRPECCSGGRVAFVAGKKNGNAVWRNSSKRRMRAIYRELDLESTNVDMVLVAKAGILSVPYQQVLEECKAAIPRIK